MFASTTLWRHAASSFGRKNSLRLGRDLSVGFCGMVRVGEPVELHLVELVQTDQPSGVTSVTAGFPAETGAVGRVAERQLIGRDDLVAMQRRHRHLGGGGQPEVVLRATEAVIGDSR